MNIKHFFRKFFGQKRVKRNLSKCKLEKSLANPILEPKKNNDWEAWQTFNPAAIYLNNKVHFLYRAIGEGGLSVLGYANSEDGINITERLNKPAYTVKEEYLKKEKCDCSNYFSGGSVAGCEDPRLVELEGRIYLIHTTFSNWSQLRLTLSSIKKEDFLNKSWLKWNKPVFISPPNQIHKNWVIFPEKINGKIAILHSISPELLIDYFDSLNFNGQFINSHYAPQVNENGWEAYSRGAGPSPIKTDKGWLLLYHAVDKKEPAKYKLGAMILDHNDPRKILYRAKEPVLEPDTVYENDGFKGGIVYSCGAVVIKGKLFVYYGGADTVTCVATADLNDFVNQLTETEKPKLKKASFLKRLFRK